MNKVQELLEKGVSNIIPNKNSLYGKLTSKVKLNIYAGVDPTSTKIHLGHAVTLRKLNEFAKAGHNVTFLIGDFTALIGDTSDKETERPPLSVTEIEENFKTYKKQAKKVLDFSKVKVRYNSEWLKKLTFEEIIQLTQHFSVGDFVGRELIKKRLSQGNRIGLHEFLYPIMQAYDSFILNTDLQIGGVDQTFNIQAGRVLLKDLKKKESFALTTPILEGNDGRKMSKSWGNAIWLDDNPFDMYAKIMSIKDNLIIQYFTLATNLSLEEISKYEQRLKKENPINIKKGLAFQIVKELHGGEHAKKAQDNFEKTIQNNDLPEDIELYIFEKAELSLNEILILSSLSKSKSIAKRVITQGGVSVDNKVIKNPNEKINLKNERLLRVGKKIFLRIINR